jgi:cellulose synthase/poly-beta-1,6-N-acetylglucosamine synthase-like glycosyltransferase
MRAFIRQSHRWLSIVFTLTVLANFAAMTRGKPPAWITYSPLPPLFLLLFSGLYLFALPYLGKSRSVKGRAVSCDSIRLSP